MIVARCCRNYSLLPYNSPGDVFQANEDVPSVYRNLKFFVKRPPDPGLSQAVRSHGETINRVKITFKIIDISKIKSFLFGECIRCDRIQSKKAF